MGKSIEKKRCSLSRRDFLRGVSGAAAAALIGGSCESSKGSSSPPENQPPASTALPPRSRQENAFVNQAGQPLLVCVTGTDFATMLAAGLSRLGGLTKLIGADQNVLIKPNCNAPEPYPGISDANSVAAIVREVKKKTAGTVSAGDQGYYPFTFDFAGMGPAVEQAGGRMLTLSNTYNVRRTTWASNVPDFKVYADVYDAPVIINTCVIKRHHTAIFTCALKNNVGAVAGPGAVLTRNFLHYQSPDFMAVVADIAGVVNPDLNIVDARSVLTAGGPSIQDGVVVDAHKLILCGDIVATDVYCAGILESLDAGFIAASAMSTVDNAVSLGLGTSDLNQVEIIEIST
jgi:uncharacterized protein (DUF362 family)